MSLTVERLRALLHYDQATGVFTRRVSRGGSAAGSVAGCPDKDGYVMLMVDRVSYKAHRLAWLYFHGEWPSGDVDHINEQTGDNRIINLRQASRSENMQNRSAANRGNRSGFLGVSRNNGRWFAQITVARKRVHLGYHDTPEAAHAAYVEAKRRLHPRGQL